VLSMNSVVIKRSFILVWVISVLLGALDHTVLPGILPFKRVVVRILPHLTYGWVMFNNIRPEQTIWYYKPQGSEELHHIADLVPNDSLLYKRARVSVNAIFVGDYIQQLCQRYPAAQQAIFEKRNTLTDHGLEPISIERYRCEAGKLIPEQKHERQ